MRPIPVRIEKAHNTNKYAFVPGWRFPSDVDRWFSDNPSRLDDPAPRPIAAIPCGSSMLGDIRFDRWPGQPEKSKSDRDMGRPTRHTDRYPRPNVVGDFNHLSFPDRSIGTIIADPPWNLQIHLRYAYMAELARVHQFEGLLLWTAPWLPLQGAWKCDGVYLGYTRVGLPRDARILVRAIRRSTNPLPTRRQFNERKKRELPPSQNRLEVGFKPTKPKSWRTHRGVAT